MRNISFIRITVVFILFSEIIIGQITRRVLFLGNSYTSVNNLPQLISDVALSAGDTLMFDSNTPGGYQLLDHNTDSVTRSKIMAGGWQYVVMQGQSQEPVLEHNRFLSGGKDLENLIKQYNPCAVPLTYMTWGRKNGDSVNCMYYPLVCTYDGMDTTIRRAYMYLSKNLNCEVSPVSTVWRYLRYNFPQIELYQSDESHPSAAGSYAAACCFYTAIFKKDPSLITNNFSLTQSEAAIIRNAAKLIVYDSLSFYDFKKPPLAQIGTQVGAGYNELNFYSRAQGINQNYLWDLGDGTIDSLGYSYHGYLSDGSYYVTLTTNTCDLQGLHTSFADTIVQFCSHDPSVFTENPWLCYNDTLYTSVADSYQWFAYDDSLPETGQFLPDYRRYAVSGFSVVTTLNGCSERSRSYSEAPLWTGYYFDAIGDPCDGDTVVFSVLHINGSLTGTENILWYKNDTLLQSLTNEDTLLIYSSGKYECRVINPLSECPVDTTTQVLFYDCGLISVNEINHDPNTVCTQILPQHLSKLTAETSPSLIIWIY
ncbi:MAG: hypothetical protein IPP27_13495 [Bacteroidetes bacterium]|nr:hypothetical protein [Bacteroidota bacterium]